MKVKFELQYRRTIFTVVTVVLRYLHYLKHSVAIFRDTVTRLVSKWPQSDSASFIPFGFLCQMNRLGVMAVTVGTVDFKNHNFPNLFIYTNSLTDRSSGHKTDRIVTKFYTLIHTINMKVKFELQYRRSIFTVVTVVLMHLHSLKHSVAIFRDTVTRFGSKWPQSNSAYFMPFGFLCQINRLGFMAVTVVTVGTLNY